MTGHIPENKLGVRYGDSIVSRLVTDICGQYGRYYASTENVIQINSDGVELCHVLVQRIDCNECGI